VNLAGTLIDLFPTAGDRSPMPGSGGQHHAYIIKLDDFDPWEAHFQAVGQKYRKTTHGMGRISLYVDDPDGYHIELTVPFADHTIGRADREAGCWQKRCSLRRPSSRGASSLKTPSSLLRVRGLPLRNCNLT
jgi:hypothetical protein